MSERLNLLERESVRHYKSKIGHFETKYTEMVSEHAMISERSAATIVLQQDSDKKDEEIK